MRGKKIVTATLAFAALLASTGGSGVRAGEDAGQHTLWVAGISTIQNQCQYEWERNGADPIRDDLGLPKPTTLPPTCRDANPNQPGIQPVPCSLLRNLGPYPPYWRAGDATKGEVGLNPPCAGTLTFASFPGAQGCTDASTSGPNCSLNAPTWFYGYCGQTYGGASGGSYEIGGQTWRIERLGFARGRGTWEFNGRMQRLNAGGQPTNDRTSFRFYFNAAPDKVAEGETIACDGGPPITSVLAAGVSVIPAPPFKIFRTNPGWHFCHNDPVTGRADDIC